MLSGWKKGESAMPKERFVHKLTEQDLDRLKEFDKEVNDRRVHDRVRATLLSHRGYNVRKIAEVLDVNHRFISNWLDRYEREGVTGLLDRPRSGRPSRVTQRYLQCLAGAVEKSPRLYKYNESNWTCPLLARYLKRETGIRISEDWMRIILLRLGFRSGRGKLRVVSPDPMYDKKNAVCCG
jgi:transposase